MRVSVGERPNPHELLFSHASQSCEDFELPLSSKGSRDSRAARLVYPTVYTRSVTLSLAVCSIVIQCHPHPLGC